MENVFSFLEALNIDYRLYNHPAVFTVAESKKILIDRTFVDNKNLFLKNKKGDRHYLVSVEASKHVDLEKLASCLNSGRLGFASEERLRKHLGLAPGSVSPFGLINDIDHEVIFVLDADLLAGEHIGFHPNINTQTIIIKTEDFERFLAAAGNKTIRMEL